MTVWYGGFAFFGRNSSAGMRSPAYAAAKPTFSRRQCSSRSSTDSAGGAEARRVVVEKLAVDAERLLVDGTPAGEILDHVRDRSERRLGRRLRVDRAAHAEDRAAVHRVERVGARVEIRRVAPRAAERVAAADLLVPHPLADVAGHVVVAVRRQARLLAHRPRRLAGEVAEGEDLGEAGEVGRAVPVVQGRQALSGERRVRRGLVPADPGDRVLGVALREAAELPRRRAGTTRPVPEQRHRVVER